eukprot:1074442_1
MCSAFCFISKSHIGKIITFYSMDIYFHHSVLLNSELLCGDQCLVQAEFNHRVKCNIHFHATNNGKQVSVYTYCALEGLINVIIISLYISIYVLPNWAYLVSDNIMSEYKRHWVK